MANYRELLSLELFPYLPDQFIKKLNIFLDKGHFITVHAHPYYYEIIEGGVLFQETGYDNDLCHLLKHIHDRNSDYLKQLNIDDWDAECNLVSIIYDLSELLEKDKIVKYWNFASIENGKIHVDKTIPNAACKERIPKSFYDQILEYYLCGDEEEYGLFCKKENV